MELAPRACETDSRVTRYAQIVLSNVCLVPASVKSPTRIERQQSLHRRHSGLIGSSKARSSFSGDQSDCRRPGPKAVTRKGPCRLTDPSCAADTSTTSPPKTLVRRFKQPATSVPLALHSRQAAGKALTGLPRGDVHAHRKADRRQGSACRNPPSRPIRYGPHRYQRVHALPPDFPPDQPPSPCRTQPNRSASGPLQRGRIP